MPSKPPGVSTPPEEPPKSRVEIAIEELIVLKAELMQLPQTASLSSAIESLDSARMWLEWDQTSSGRD